MTLRARLTGAFLPATGSHGLILVVLGVAMFSALAAIGAARVLATHQSVDALSGSRDQLRGNLERLGDVLSSTHDLSRLLRVVLASAVSATGAGAGLVLIAEEGGQLRFHHGEGFDEGTTDLLRTLAVHPGSGLLGSVAATGTARRGRVAGAAAAAGGSPLLSTGEPVCRTYLAVPLRVPARRGADGANRPGAVHGVLALYDRIGGDDFDDTDLRAVLTFAGHAAVAVRNVRLHEEARRLSHTDALTGLYNYRHLMDLLRREIHRAARFGHPLCAVTLDLDRFKEVNDVYGHAAGDDVLVEFARRIAREIRSVDFAFRAGGEEFVLLLPETDAVGGVTLARRLRTAVRRDTFPVRSRQGPETTVAIRVTVSIGVAVFPEHGTTGAQVLQAADDALYAAKAAGRNTYRLAPRPRRTAAAAPPGTVPSGASGGPHPPRQSRGR